MMHQAYISAMAWERGQGELSVYTPREMPDEQITMLETVDGEDVVCMFLLQPGVELPKPVA